MTDWKLINQALIAINWLKEINDPENANKTLLTILDENKESLFLKNERVLNAGVLIMAAYILFVYPREKEFSQLDISSIDISKFKITHEEGSNGSSSILCRRIRNSISHAKFEILHDSHMIKFHDDNLGKDKIEFEIPIVDFGTFLDNFILEVNKKTSSPSY